MDLQQLLFPPRVAVVEISGQIGARLSPREVSRLLQSLRNDARYPAVVLDVDSPGGGPAASEAIYLGVKRLREKKPVAAAIRGVGASGGYMVACGADPIFALPTSIVGSIGVIWMMPMVADALERLGIRMRTRTSGEYKDMGSLFRESTPEEEERLNALLHSVYDRFVEIVAEGRSELSEAQVRELATGEIHTGARARELGLIDHIGDLEDAIAWAAEAAGIPRRSATLRPRRGLMQMLMQRSADTAVASIETALHDRLTPHLR